MCGIKNKNVHKLKQTEKEKETCSESTDKEDAAPVVNKVAVERHFGSVLFAVFFVRYFDSELGWAGKTHAIRNAEPVLY